MPRFRGKFHCNKIIIASQGAAAVPCAVMVWRLCLYVQARFPEKARFTNLLAESEGFEPSIQVYARILA